MVLTHIRGESSGSGRWWWAKNEKISKRMKFPYKLSALVSFKRDRISGFWENDR
jgi:hypothetical protein